MLAGFHTRYVAIALVPIMLGALSVHAGNGLLFSNPNGGWEFPVFWTVILLVQALLGDGAYSVRSLFAEGNAKRGLASLNA